MLSINDYPGIPISSSLVVLQDSEAALISVPKRSVSQWRINSEFGATTLNEFLVRSNEAPVEKRVPVLGVGSNSSASVLRSKIQRFNDANKTTVSSVIPMLRLDYEAVQVGILPRPSRPGYFAFTPVLEGGPEFLAPLGAVQTVALLDEFQLKVVDETEPNYVRKLIGNRVPLSTECPSYLEDCFAYVSLWGHVLAPIGKSREIESQFELRELLRDSSLELGTLMDSLETHPKGDLDNWVLMKAAKVNKELHSLGLIDIPGLAPNSKQASVNFEDLFRSCELEGSELRVGRTLAGVRNRFMPIAQIDKSHQIDFAAKYVFVERIHHIFGGSFRYKLLARLERADTPAQTVRLDQLIRNGLGVEVGETVVLKPASFSFGLFSSFVVGAPRFQVFRRQVADIAVVEQASCLMDSTAMEILGIERGEKVVIYGQPKTGSRPTKVRLRAISSDERVEKRATFKGGSLRSRYPDSSSALGVYPDLPWVFFDADVASTLGITDSPLAPVLVRASRSNKLINSLSELGLAFAVILATSQINPLALIFLPLVWLLLRRKIRSQTGSPTILKALFQRKKA